MRVQILVLACLSLATFCRAHTFTVDDDGPADFNNIQDAVDAAWHVDTIVVNPGTYNETVYSNGGAWTLTSTDPNDPNIVETTIITGGVIFAFYEQSDTVLTGFTITNENGRGIECLGASPTIRRNIITGCSRGIHGSGAASPTVSNCTIQRFRQND